MPNIFCGEFVLCLATIWFCYAIQCILIFCQNVWLQKFVIHFLRILSNFFCRHFDNIFKAKCVDFKSRFAINTLVYGWLATHFKIFTQKCEIENELSSFSTFINVCQYNVVY